jgi:hypothetical protein
MAFAVFGILNQFPIKQGSTAEEEKESRLWRDFFIFIGN